jgi:hypothetical protein
MPSRHSFEIATRCVSLSGVFLFACEGARMRKTLARSPPGGKKKDRVDLTAAVSMA